MRNIVENSTGLSKFLLPDDTRIIMSETQIDVGPEEKLDFIVGCHSSNDCTLYENVTLPDDYVGNKYLYVDGEWSINPEWVDFRIAVDPVVRPAGT